MFVGSMIHTDKITGLGHSLVPEGTDLNARAYAMQRRKLHVNGCKDRLGRESARLGWRAKGEEGTIGTLQLLQK